MAAPRSGRRSPPLVLGMVSAPLVRWPHSTSAGPACRVHTIHSAKASVRVQVDQALALAFPEKSTRCLGTIPDKHLSGTIPDKLLSVRACHTGLDTRQRCGCDSPRLPPSLSSLL